jgi:sirohydrochlorin cobaltochelatase
MPETNEEISRLTDKIREGVGARYDRVSYAFLEFANPSFEEGLESWLRAGAREIVILPYLLAVGRHLKTDIPEFIKIKEGEHPEVKFSVAPYAGSAEGMPELLLSLLP